MFLKYSEFYVSVRATVNRVMQDSNEYLDVAVINLEAIQFKVLAFDENKIVQASISHEIFQIMSVPNSDGTNAWSF